MMPACSFAKLLEEIRDQGKTVVLVHSALGGVKCNIIDISSDTLKLKMFDMEQNMCYNVYVPVNTISAVQIEDGPAFIDEEVVITHPECIVKEDNFNEEGSGI